MNNFKILAPILLLLCLCCHFNILAQDVSKQKDNAPVSSPHGYLSEEQVEAIAKKFLKVDKLEYPLVFVPGGNYKLPITPVSAESDDYEDDIGLTTSIVEETIAQADGKGYWRNCINFQGDFITIDAETGDVAGICKSVTPIFEDNVFSRYRDAELILKEASGDLETNKPLR